MSILKRNIIKKQVAGLGLEPRLLVPKTSVLPLDDPAIHNKIPYIGYLFHTRILYC